MKMHRVADEEFLEMHRFEGVRRGDTKVRKRAINEKAQRLRAAIVFVVACWILQVPQNTRSSVQMIYKYWLVMQAARCAHILHPF